MKESTLKITSNVGITVCTLNNNYTATVYHPAHVSLRMA